MEDSAWARVNRRADDAIYLGVDRFEEPKEVFKRLGATLQSRHARDSQLRVLDAGCATGELIYYLSRLFPSWTFTGVDVSPALIAAARTHQIPNADFSVVSVLEPDFFRAGMADAVLCSGVLQIFDDISIPIGNLLRTVAPHGEAHFLAPVNDDPIDVLVRYRDNHERPEGRVHDWQSGWNIFCKETFERVIKGHAPSMHCEWRDFAMPFAISKSDDPMRSWTIATETSAYQTVNGACQLLNLKFLSVLP